jgi:putative transposase
MDAVECVGPNPTDRAKAGVKKSGCPLGVVEGAGGPLAVCIAGANVPDISRLADTLDADTLDAVVVERPKPTEEAPQHLCLDKGYDNSTGYSVCQGRDYTPHLRRIGEEKVDVATGEKKYPARRWVVERTLGWLSRCRGILIRWDKKAECYLASVKLACALLWFRRLYKMESDARVLK